MNSNVCVVTFIFLTLENVAGLICKSWLWGPNTAIEQQPPSIGKPDDGTHDFNCLSPNLYYLWDNDHQNGNPQIAINNIPPQAWVNTTRFIIKEELIDNNAEIFCANSSNNDSKETTHARRAEFLNTVIVKLNSFFNFGSKKHVYNERTLIKIEVNETFKDNEKRSILEYNEKKNVSFSCLENNITTTNIELGLINMTSNMIATYEANSTHKIFNKTDNGTILCCVYFVVNATAEEKWITRHVANKTLLLYNDTVQQDALGGKDADSSQPTNVIIITTAVAVVFILLLIIVICTKRCRKKPEMDSKVLYADLDILRQSEKDTFPRPVPEEESPYAQIIGVIRPQNK